MTSTAEQFNKLIIGIRTEVIQSKYRKYFSEILENDLANNRYIGTDLQNIYNKAKELRSIEASKQYYFITICPYEDVQLIDLMKTMDRVLKKKWINDYIYVYEQRQDDINFPIYGLHIHMIVKRETICKSDVIREIFNTAKNIVGSKQSIDVKLLDKKDMMVRLNYILGTKSTKEKQAKQNIDKIFRQQNNIEPYYQNNFLSYIQEYNALLPT